jgi:hypothetical protein
MRINAAIRLFTYDCRVRLQRCWLGQGNWKQLAGAALISFARGGPTHWRSSLDLVFLWTAAYLGRKLKSEFCIPTRSMLEILDQDQEPETSGDGSRDRCVEVRTWRDQLEMRFPSALPSVSKQTVRKTGESERMASRVGPTSSGGPGGSRCRPEGVAHPIRQLHHVGVRSYSRSAELVDGLRRKRILALSLDLLRKPRAAHPEHPTPRQAAPFLFRQKRDHRIKDHANFRMVGGLDTGGAWGRGAEIGLAASPGYFPGAQARL